MLNQNVLLSAEMLNMFWGELGGDLRPRYSNIFNISAERMRCSKKSHSFREMLNMLNSGGGLWN